MSSEDRVQALINRYISPDSALGKNFQATMWTMEKIRWLTGESLPTIYRRFQQRLDFLTWQESRKKNPPEPSPSASSPQPEIPDLQGPAPACPESMAWIENFCVDRFEAHLTVDGQPHPHELRPPAGKAFAAASDRGDFPKLM